MVKNLFFLFAWISSTAYGYDISCNIEKIDSSTPTYSGARFFTATLKTDTLTGEATIAYADRAIQPGDFTSLLNESISFDEHEADDAENLRFAVIDGLEQKGFAIYLPPDFGEHPSFAAFITRLGFRNQEVASESKYDVVFCVHLKPLQKLAAKQ